jgi:multisubunit Na+/H+ antiporter MnhC subunit
MVLLILAGLRCLLAQGSLFKKAAAWALFQAGVGLLWFSITFDKGVASHPLPYSLILSLGLVSLAVFLILWVMAAGVLRQYGTAQEKAIQKQEAP